MSELEKILEKEVLPKGLDFIELYREGILSLRELSGDIWTDFNIHDPGVTILEQLCYSLTDLYFRSSFEVKEILASNKRAVDIFSAEKIFPSNPTTNKDIRKKLIHDIPELNNVWVLPVSAEESSFRGIYNLWLDLDNPKISDEKLALLIEKVKKRFCSIRNLCEDLAHIKILEPLPIKVFASVQVDDSRIVEDVYAEILSKISRFFRPSINFFSFEEKIKDNLLSDVFEGPSLSKGYIEEDELSDKPSRILISDLIKLALEIEGVVSVKKMQLSLNGKVCDDQLIVPKEKIPHLENILDFTTIDGIVLSSSNFTYKNVNFESLKRKVNVLNLDKGIVFGSTLKTKHEEPDWELETYDSLQYDMPEVYGIGELGLRNSDTQQRKAAAKQLKAYLLFFEQVMANYLSQLANITNLFSYPIDNHSYFYQHLENIPRIEDVQMSKVADFIEHPHFSEYKIPKNYKEGLTKLLSKFDNFIERQNRFMDFLLALNGEVFNDKALQQTNSYYSEQEFQVQLLKYKQRFLYHLASINHGKAKAYDYLSPDSQKDISGLQIKASILLGFESHFEKKLSDGFREPYVADSFLNYGLELVAESKILEIDAGLNAKIEENILTDNFDYVDSTDYDKISFTEEELKQRLEKTTIFETNEIYTELFEEGPNIENYLVGQIDDKFVLVFQKYGTKSWRFLGSFENEKEAGEASLAFVQLFRQIGVKAEGMYLIEHILLRPRLSLKRFGFYLLDTNLEVLLYSNDLYTYNDRNEALAQVEKDIYKRENFDVKEAGKGEFEIVFETSDKKIKMTSVRTYSSVEEVYGLLEETFLFLSDKYEIVPFERKYKLFVKYTKPKERIDEDFFSYKASVILPNWTNRCSNPEFQNMVEKMTRQLAPAYVSLDFYWLSPQKMKRFEHSYLMWKEGFLRLDQPEDNVMNKNMVRYLFEYKNELLQKE